MPQGVPTDDAVIAEFRARYLYSGNASKVARELGIDERTGRNIAQRLDESGEFSEACRQLHASALRRHIAMRLRIAEVAHERFEDETGGIDVKQLGENGPTIITDKRHEYGKLVLDAEKNAHNIAKLEAEKNKPDEAPVEVHVHLKPAKADGSDGE